MLRTRLLDKVERLGEREVRFYSGSLVLALEHMQFLDIVYRDLKPENVLLDAQVTSIRPIIQGG